MPHCTRCGAQIPRDEEARFCPSCGAPRTPQAVPDKAWVAKVKARAGRKIAAPKSRVSVTAVVLVLCFVVTSLGAVAKVEPSEAQEILRDLEDLEEMLEVAGIQIIFGNNLMHCLIMFTPVLGPFYGFYVLYSTGRVLAAMGSVAAADPMLLFAALFIYPHAWMEYLSYSLAISESLWLSYSVVRNRLRGFRGELMKASQSVAICSVLLLLGAFVEMFLISSVSA